jgi:hypothetical protein
MEALEETMKKHNINLDSSSSNSYSHGLALSGFASSFNATSTSSSNEWLIDYGSYYHIAKDKATFYALNEYNMKQICIGDDRSLSVVDFGTTQPYDDHFNDTLFFQSLPTIFYQCIKSLIQVKVKQ